MDLVETSQWKSSFLWYSHCEDWQQHDAPLRMLQLLAHHCDPLNFFRRQLLYTSVEPTTKPTTVGGMSPDLDPYSEVVIDFERFLDSTPLPGDSYLQNE